MKFNIKYFASLRERAEKSSEVINGEFENLDELYGHLNEKYSFNMDQKVLRASVNGEYCEFNYRPSNNDIVVFIPPVAGG